MTTLYIRHPARAQGEGALCRFAQALDNGAIGQQGEGLLRNLGDLIAASRRVVLVLAASDVTLLSIKAPPLAGARLRAALPALVEEHVLGDPEDCVLVAGPAAADGHRPVAVVQQAWLEPLVRALPRSAPARLPPCPNNCACRCIRAASAPPSATAN